MKLVTFGCSWTKGASIHYTKGMTREEFDEGGNGPAEKQLRETSTFRIHLSQRLNYTNINFSSGGSSNQRQERLATEYFNTNSPEDTVVLWGITSTKRNELPIDGKLKNFMYGSNSDRIRYHYDHFYDEKTELHRLSHSMIHWNKFFEANNIPNLWFQTFNTYRFPQKIDRLLPRDLLTLLTRRTINDSHQGLYHVDCKRIHDAKDKGLVNPYTLHPTVDTHILLADILEKPLREILIS